MAAGALGFVLYLMLAMVALRVERRRSPAVIVTALAVAGYPATLALAILWWERPSLWAVSATYAFAVLVFLMAFGAIYKSVSLRILADLSRRPGWRESRRDLLARYIERESYQSRLAVLAEEGLAVDDATGFRLTGKGRRLARVARALQRAWKIDRSG
jgi:hypothetical protein